MCSVPGSEFPVRVVDSSASLVAADFSGFCSPLVGPPRWELTLTVSMPRTASTLGTSWCFHTPIRIEIGCTALTIYFCSDLPCTGSFLVL